MPLYNLHSLRLKEALGLRSDTRLVNLEFADYFYQCSVSNLISITVTMWRYFESIKQGIYDVHDLYLR